MRPVVGIRVVGVHVLDGVEDALRVQCVVVLLDVVPHHHVEKLPADVVGRSQSFILICKDNNLSTFKFKSKQSKRLTKEVGGVVPGDPGEVLQLRVVLLVLVGDGDELGERHEVVRGPLLVPPVLRRRDVDLRDRRPRPRPDLGLELQVGQLGERPIRR